MMKNKITLSLLQCGALFLALSLFRLIFLIYYWDYFVRESYGDILFGYVHGIRFDGVVIGKTIGLIIVLRFLLGRFSSVSYIPHILTGIGGIILFFYWSAFWGGLAYFELIKRHISFDIFLVLGELDGAINNAFTEYWGILSVALVTFLGASYLWFHYFLPMEKSAARSSSGIRPKSIWQYVYSSVTAIVAVVFLARGGWQEKPFIDVLAFRYNSPTIGQLTLSAPFNLIGLMNFDQRKNNIHFFPDREANETMRELFAQPNERFPKADYPLFRKTIADSATLPNRRPNVIFLVMESWAANHVGAYNPEFTGVTPNIDRLASSGLFFKHVWGNGHYTKHGFASIFASVPAYPDLILLNSSLFGNNVTSLPGIFYNLDYATMYVQASHEGSSNIDYFMRRLGTDYIYTMEDVPDFENKSGTWGIHDEYIYDFFLEKTDRLKEPFFAVVANATSHSPFKVPSKKWEVYPPEDPRAKTKNIMHYSDHWLGDYFNAVSKKAYFNNTVFVIVSDHIAGTDPKQYFERGKIPLIVYAPGGHVRNGVNTTYMMQTDIVPTLLDMLNISAGHASAGMSVFRKSPETAFAVHFTGDLLLWVQGRELVGFNNYEPVLLYDLKTDPDTAHNIISNQAPSAALMRAFKSYHQVTRTALTSNKLMAIE